VMKQNILAKDLILNTVLFMDEQMMAAGTDCELQRAACTLNNIVFKSQEIRQRQRL
jgi:hypothetical protein